jgi:hypothetical protein
VFPLFFLLLNIFSLYDNNTLNRYIYQIFWIWSFMTTFSWFIYLFFGWTQLSHPSSQTQISAVFLDFKCLWPICHPIDLDDDQSIDHTLLSYFTS